MSQHAREIAHSQRFEFGRNWQQFLATVDAERIAHAERCLAEMLDLANLEGASFLDAGSGSGLSSLAARRLGARVHSFDYDPQSVECTRRLKNRYSPDDPLWTIDEGSVLDTAYLESLGVFDVVYAWGVLHHTGALKAAMQNVILPVGEGGRLFVAIYNQQRIWTSLNVALKRAYVSSPAPIRGLMASAFMGLRAGKGLAADLLHMRNPAARYRQYVNLRGMSWWYDNLDWLGGYPYEAATPESVVEFYQERGFTVEKLVKCRNSGCNQFIFRHVGRSAAYSGYDAMRDS